MIVARVARFARMRRRHSAADAAGKFIGFLLVPRAPAILCNLIPKS